MTSVTAGRTSGLAWWSAATIFVSAFLLFQVQPVISKTILPWFGGSPAVWTTALLFFQIALLGGYAYAHLLIRYVPLARQPLVHTGLLLLALFTLPITPGDFWKPADGAYPELRIMLLLLAKVGPTYFILSSTGPLIQAWFSQAYPGHSPYRLYALSNVGSLAALLSYPFLFEILLTVRTQGSLWSLGFVIFAGLISIMSLGVWKLAEDERQKADVVSKLPESIRPVFDQPVDETLPPSGLLMIGWVLLAALGTTALMAITNHVCQDISVDPFMWVVPLSLYLLSLIICFDSERWYIRRLWGPLTLGAILLLSALNNVSAVDEFLTWAQTPLKLEEPLTFTWAFDKILAGIGWIVSKLDLFIQRVFDPTWGLSFDLTTESYGDNLIAQAIVYVTVLFLICMVAHGELVKSKPAPRHLTMYFLLISAGGAVGGVFVALICPLIFQTHFELPLCLLAGFLVGWVALANDGRESWLKGREYAQWAAAFVVAGTVLLVAKSVYEPIEEGTVIDRNFYGVLSVKKLNQDDPSNAGRALYHGRILHGFQFRQPIEPGETVLYRAPGASQPEEYRVDRIELGKAVLVDPDGHEIKKDLASWDLELANPDEDWPRELDPNTYYLPSTGVGLAASEYPRLVGQGMKVGVIGLGTGTMITHGKAGDTYRFYDIDPKVVAMQDKYFTYLRKSPAESEVVLGDARIRMEREPDQSYDLIVLDAFSGDAIPGHLLTVEAFEQYLRHLKKNNQGEPVGIIAVHISNRYLDLEPVVAALARRFELPAKIFHVEEGDNGNDNGDTGSDWILLSRNDEFWHSPSVELMAQPLTVKPEKELLWTDQQRSLVPILK
jgi:hypothetical protein